MEENGNCKRSKHLSQIDGVLKSDKIPKVTSDAVLWYFRRIHQLNQNFHSNHGIILHQVLKDER